jgi:hypothetical protein
MAVIRLDAFGGESPRTPARNLPAGMAQLSNNLLATATEFRPLLGELPVSTLAISNPKTIRRFTKTTAGNPDISDFTASWGASPDYLSLAKGQINDDLTERTYYTNDSAAAGTGGARVFDNTGFDKALGVPPPGVPTVVATIANEYTYEEDTNARVRIPGEMEVAVFESATEIRIGDALSPAPTASTAGWLTHEAAIASGVTVTQAAGDFAYLTPMSGDAIIQTELAYLTDVAFGGKKVTYLGGTHWAVGLGVQGIGYTVNGTTLTTKFKAIQTPDPQTVRPVGADFDTTTQQFSNAEVATAVQMFVAEYSVDAPAIAPTIRNLNTAREGVIQAMLNYQNQTTLAAMVTAFYSKTDVAAEITAAIGNFAKSIVTAEVGILTPPVFEGGG